MQTIPIQPVPNQTLATSLNGQIVNINIYDKSAQLYADVLLNGDTIVSNVICRNAVPLVCREYLGFIGNLIFFDTQGTSDPVYTELGTRYELIYLTADEYGQL